MPRRITSGTVGAQVLGDIVTQNNSLQSIVVDANIVLSPNGTGNVETTSNMQIADDKELRLSDGSTYVAFKAPATINNGGGPVVLTFPDNDGSANQVLQSDGSGNLTFVAPALSISAASTGTPGTFYPAFIDSTSGTEDTLGISSGELSFTPNPGRLTVKYLTVSTDATITNDLVVTQDFSAATITETSSIVYKENVNPITNALDTILQLQGVTYDRKGTDHKSEAGLIAEEVAPILPNIVSFKDDKPEGINYTKLTAYLIEAVKTLKAELDKVKNG
jgi:hypothetical protein